MICFDDSPQNFAIINPAVLECHAETWTTTYELNRACHLYGIFVKRLHLHNFLTPFIKTSRKIETTHIVAICVFYEHTWVCFWEKEAAYTSTFRDYTNRTVAKQRCLYCHLHTWALSTITIHKSKLLSFCARSPSLVVRSIVGIKVSFYADIANVAQRKLTRNVTEGSTVQMSHGVREF